MIKGTRKVYLAAHTTARVKELLKEMSVESGLSVSLLVHNAVCEMLARHGYDQKRRKT